MEMAECKASAPLFIYGPRSAVS